jgi:hypothetical protein
VRERLRTGVLAGVMLCAAMPSWAQPQATSPVARGKYIVDTGGCHDCHSPKKMGAQGPEVDVEKMLSGFQAGTNLPPAPKIPEGGPWAGVMTWDLNAWSGAWGMSYAANLTPDVATGLGSWSEAMFISAMRTGKHMGSGRPILPPMPWQTIGKLTDPDLKAVFAYLKSLKPMKNLVPAPTPPAK